MYALYDFGNCSQSLSLSRAELLETCGFTVQSGRCRPQYFMSVLCARLPQPTTSSPVPSSAVETVSPTETTTEMTELLETASSKGTPPSLLSSSRAASMESSVSTSPSVTTPVLKSKV